MDGGPVATPFEPDFLSHTVYAPYPLLPMYAVAIPLRRTLLVVVVEEGVQKEKVPRKSVICISSPLQLW